MESNISINTRGSFKTIKLQNISTGFLTYLAFVSNTISITRFRTSLPVGLPELKVDQRGTCTKRFDKCKITYQFYLRLLLVEDDWKLENYRLEGISISITYRNKNWR